MTKRIDTAPFGSSLSQREGEERVFSRRQAAAWLQISERTLDRLRGRGKVRSCRVGGRILFRMSDLSALLSAGEAS